MRLGNLLISDTSSPNFKSIVLTSIQEVSKPSMIKPVTDFLRRPVVYRTLLLMVLVGFIYIELVAPLTGLWSPREATMLDMLFMKGR
jgi:hypothetical protein